MELCFVNLIIQRWLLLMFSMDFKSIHVYLHMCVHMYVCVEKKF